MIFAKGKKNSGKKSDDSRTRPWFFTSCRFPYRKCSVTGYEKQGQGCIFPAG